MTKRAPLGTVLCLIAATGYGLSPIFAKEAYATGVNVQTLLTFRFAIAAMVFWSFVAYRRPDRPSPAVLAGCVALGAVGYAAQSALFFGSLTRLDASLAALLLYVYPALVTLLAVALRRESLDLRRAAALACAALGVLLLLGADGVPSPGAVSGVILALGAAAVYALYLTVADGLPKGLDLYLLSALVCTGAGTTIAVTSAATGALVPPASASAWLWVSMLALVGTVVPVLTMFAGVRAVGAPTAAILCSAEPAVTLLVSALVYGEHLSLAQFVGGAAVLAAILVKRPGTQMSDGRSPAWSDRKSLTSRGHSGRSAKASALQGIRSRS